MLLEAEEEMEDARWLIKICDCLLGYYGDGEIWQIDPFPVVFDSQLAQNRRPHSSPTISMAAIMLNGYCKDAQRNEWSWEDVEQHIVEVRDKMALHIHAQQDRLRVKTRG